MRVIWMLAGVGGFTAVAAGSPTWTTVVDSNTPIDSGNVLSSVNQVVVGNGGVVGITGTLNFPSNDIVLYSTPTAGSYSNTIAAEQGTPIDGNSVGAFDNLAISANAAGGNRLTFVSTRNQYGVFQFDSNAGVSKTVAYDGVGGVSFDHSANPAGGGTLALQVNPGGQALFPISPSTPTLVVGDVTAANVVTPIFTSGSTFGANTYTLVSAANRVAINSNSVGTALLSVNNGSGATTGVYSFTANNVEPVLQSVSYTPSAVLGSAVVSGNDATLFEDSTFGQNVIVHVGVTEVNAVHFADVSYGGIFGGVSANGNAAFYGPDQFSGSTTLDYFKVTPAGATVPVSLAAGATVIDGAGTATITSFDPSPLSSPMVNNNGVVVFFAIINGHDALVEWTPSILNSQPQVLLQVGDPYAGSTISGFLVNSLLGESDSLKSSLSNDNHLGVIVGLDNGNTDVLITQLPEPGFAMVVPIVAAATLLRRRRTSSN